MRFRTIVCGLSLLLALSLAACQTTTQDEPATTGGSEVTATTSAEEPEAEPEQEPEEEPELDDIRQAVEPIEAEPNHTGSLSAFKASSRPTDQQIIGYYVESGDVVDNLSVLDDYEVTSDGVSIADQEILAEGEAFTALTVQGNEETGSSTVNVDNVKLTATDEGDGSAANDFVGTGTLIVAYGATADAHNRVNLNNVEFNTTGFMRNAIVLTDYADAVITDSTFVMNGDNPIENSYDGYHISASTDYMISPPWVLGISGGVRAMGLLGETPSLTIADSEIEAGSWAVITTDEGSSSKINVVDSTLRIAGDDTEHGMNGGSDLFGYSKRYGTGYCSFAIGGANESFWGCTLEGSTYASILYGSGDMYYGASPSSLDLENAAGDVVLEWEGEEQDTVVNTVFGLMDTMMGGTATLDEGSIWNTEDAVILKHGTASSDYTISGAELNPANGTILSMIDDQYGIGTSGDASATAYDGNTFGAMVFDGGFYDDAGVGRPSELGNHATGGNLACTVTFDGGEYEGNLFNGLGSSKGTSAGGLQVNLAGATLTGAITSSDAVYGMPYSEDAVAYLDALADEYGDGISTQGGTGGPNGDGTFTVKYAFLDEDGKETTDESKAAYIQFIEFTSNEYYMVQHVVNFPVAAVNVGVTLTDGAVWNVDSDCYITYLDIADGCTVEVADGCTLYVGDQKFTGSVDAGTYGEAVPEGSGSSGGISMGGFNFSNMDEMFDAFNGGGAPGGAPSGAAPGGAAGGGAASGSDASATTTRTFDPVKIWIRKIEATTV